MTSNAMIKKLITPGLVLGALGLMAAPAMAADFYLCAGSTPMTMPNGDVVTMWGFARDVGGDLSDGCDTPITVPGPRLTVAPGDSTLNIHLRNDLAEPVSIVIPGQEMPDAGSCPAPVWTDGSSGARTSASQRVRSFGCEAAPSGGMQDYTWSLGTLNPLVPGTYIYHSGSHPQLQVQMGLYGAVRQDVAAGEAYPGSTYDAQSDLFYSEVDPALHSSPTAANSVNYNPEHFLLQRYSSDTTVVDASIDPSSTVCIPGPDVGEDGLLRLYNAGLNELKPMMIGSHFDVVAEGGKPYQFARSQYSALLQPMGTRDLLWAPDEEGTFPLIERGLSLTDPGPVFGTVQGGQQTCFTVAGGAVPTPAGGPADNDSDGYDASVDCNDSDASVNPGATEVKHDGIDQDCNGYDLTIDITRARYVTSKDKLIVWATSDLAGGAALKVTIALQGGGSTTKNLNWKANKGRWQRVIGAFSSNFGTAESVTVFGPEGLETSPVEVK